VAKREAFNVYEEEALVAQREALLAYTNPCIWVSEALPSIIRVSAAPGE
jgi:hypothetical protein